MPEPRIIPDRGVSLSGKTRLTYREASALLTAAVAGEMELSEDGGGASLAERNCMAKAIQKLKTAMEKVGGFDERGYHIDPFKK